MKFSEQRAIAAGAARSIIRAKSLDNTLENAECVLDELARVEPEKIAAQWWLNASENQVNLFRSEWRRSSRGIDYCTASSDIGA